MKVRVHHNGDDVFIAWRPDGLDSAGSPGGFIPECRGFALLRRRNGVEEPVSTWVGFEDDTAEPGERRSSSDWPIQKYQWTDYMADPGDSLQYRVLPMIGPDKRTLRVDVDHASDWTPAIRLTHEVTPRMEAYFNRGIVAAEWVSRRLGLTDQTLAAAKLQTVIATPQDPFREYLAGPLGARLFELLEQVADEQREVYAALYELDDPQLEAALVKIGQRAHVVLGNGSVKKKGEDQNAGARAALAGAVDLHARLSAPRALAHNKFLVVCNRAGKPEWVWTGSQNWTRTGLCTQANNSVYIRSQKLAAEYRKQWDLLPRVAGDASPATLKQGNTTPRPFTVRSTKGTLWFTPDVGQVDLAEARSIIEGAQQAILFLMFNPGPADSLLNKIIDRARAGVTGKRLYIHGAINQDPSTTKTPVRLFDATNWERADFEVVLPAAIDEPTRFFRREMKKLPGTFAMVHSKVVLVDPLGAHPVVITGSHNLGPKASGTNDENLLIIRDAPGLASAYATNIMAIYNQYRWRFRRHAQPVAKRWKGLQDTDRWQRGYLRAGSTGRREMDFWVGD